MSTSETAREQDPRHTRDPMIVARKLYEMAEDWPELGGDDYVMINAAEMLLKLAIKATEPPDAQPEPRTPDEALAVELLELTGRHVMPAEGDAVLIKAAKRLREMAGKRLSFDDLRAANVARQAHYRDKATCDFVAWRPADWMTALIGEIGETANMLKKINRGDYTLDEKRDEIADEIADFQVYADLLAWCLGIDLGAATARKFNAVSDRVGSPIRLPAHEHSTQPGEPFEPCYAQLLADARQQLAQGGGDHA